MRNQCYPFAAIVGQERAKMALLLNLVNPRIGGVLFCGEKGTAKSTLVRGAAGLGEKEIVDLPLNATEDMLVGSVDFETAIKAGVRCFAGGLLERANGNILYVDEVNLLSDSMAAVVTEAASSEENLVEREGISYRHDCSFILVGTMNPEEGGLRPQFLDKFGLYVEVAGEGDLEKRVEIIRRRIAYERDPREFCKAYEPENDKLRKKITAAAALFTEVRADENVRRIAAKIADSASCEGNRAELLLMETAYAVAAMDGRKFVSAADLKEAAEFVLPHRRREMEQQQNLSGERQKIQDGSEQEKEGTAQDPFPPQELMPEGDAEGQGQQDTLNVDGREQAAGGREQEEDGQERVPPESQQNSSGADTGTEAPEEGLVAGEEIYRIIRLPGSVRDRLARRGTGRRRRTNSSAGKGRYVGFSMGRGKGQTDIALDATFRAAAPFQGVREKNGCALVVEERDFRYKRRETHVGATIVFVVDASGSMGAKRRMKETKEAVLSMLMNSYQKRDRIGLITFRQNRAEVLLGITSSADLAGKELQALPTGGRTPLADGLYSAWQLLKARKQKDPEMLPMVVLVTDGRANCPLWSEEATGDAMKAAELIANDRIPAMVVDTENEYLSFHLAEKIALAMKANYYKISELKSTQLKGIVAFNRENLTT